MINKELTNDIGIITFHRTTNFGSCLQAYALYQKIQMLGYNCEVIDYRCRAIEKRENLDVKIFSKGLKNTVKNILFLPGYKKKANSLNDFFDENVSLSKPFYKENIKEAVYSNYIVGSDIVWGRDITDSDYTYFLDFVEHGKKNAFSSSIGNCTAINDENKLIELLSKFDNIAVRENDAQQWLEKLTGKHIDWVCDPTMLLDKNEWIENIQPVKYKDNYVLIYFRDPKGKCIEDAKKYAEMNNLKVYCINYERPIKGVKNIKPKSLNEFLGLILSAKMIFTASYHGMLFSLYFNKEMLFYTRAHSSRMISLSNKLGIENRCGDSVDILSVKPIDYGIVNKKIQDFRENSTEILIKMLEKE